MWKRIIAQQNINLQERLVIPQKLNSSPQIQDWNEAWWVNFVAKGQRRRSWQHVRLLLIQNILVTAFFIARMNEKWGSAARIRMDLWKL